MAPCQLLLSTQPFGSPVLGKPQPYPQSPPSGVGSATEMWSMASRAHPGAEPHMLGLRIGVCTPLGGQKTAVGRASLSAALEDPRCPLTCRSSALLWAVLFSVQCLGSHPTVGLGIHPDSSGYLPLKTFFFFFLETKQSCVCRVHPGV